MRHRPEQRVSCYRLSAVRYATKFTKQVKHSFNYKDVVSGKHPELNIVLQPADVIVVP